MVGDQGGQRDVRGKCHRFPCPDDFPGYGQVSKTLSFAFYDLYRGRLVYGDDLQTTCVPRSPLSGKYFWPQGRVRNPHGYVSANRQFHPHIFLWICSVVGMRHKLVDWQVKWKWVPHHTFPHCSVLLVRYFNSMPLWQSQRGSISRRLLCPGSFSKL